MAQIKQAALDRELKRWMRPDWRSYWKPGHENDPLYRLYEDVERKYSPDQPRVPAGSSEGGQWTRGGGVSVKVILDKAKQISSAGGNSYQRCLDLCYPILERFIRPGSDRNTFDFHKCMNACLGKNQ
jgi:hypothetical protein